MARPAGHRIAGYGSGKPIGPMRRRFNTPVRLAIAAAFAVALAGAGLAFARTVMLETDSASQRIGGSQRGKAIATCPGGSHVVSGGFAAPGRVYAGGGPYTEALSARRHGHTGFAVKGLDDGPFRHGKIYAYAYCGDLGPITVASKRSAPISSFRAGHAVARCPAGLTAISGGFAGRGTRGQPRMIPYVSKRIGTRRWKVAAFNEVLKGSQQLIAYAYCAPPPPGLATRAHLARLQDFNLGSAGSSCAPGEEAIAGGFSATTPKGGRGDADAFSSYRRADGLRWKVSLINGSARVKQVRVFAYCVPG
jgi:hypothetical protein